MKKDLFIWLDDVRVLPTDTYKYYKKVIWAQTYEDAIEALNSYIDFTITIDFDHDLGTEKTGYDVAKYIVENNIKIANFSVHSANPVGAQNIIQLLEHYGYNYI